MLFRSDEEHGYAIGKRSTRKEGTALAEALAASKALTRLRELDLRHRNIGDAGLKALVGAAKALPALRQLDLVDCGLTLPGVKVLAESDLGARLLYVNFDSNSNLTEHEAKLKEMFPNAHVEEPFEYVD